MAKGQQSMKSWESLYASESNPKLKALILRKAKAGVSLAKFRTIYQNYKSATSRRFKRLYLQQLRAL